MSKHLPRKFVTVFACLMMTASLPAFAQMSSARTSSNDSAGLVANMDDIDHQPSSLETLQDREKAPMFGQNKGSSGSSSSSNAGYNDGSGEKSNNGNVSTSAHHDKLEKVVQKDTQQDMAVKIRHDSQKEAALSYGARGGLAWRTREIMDRLKQNEAGLNKAFDFRRLLISAPSSMYIEPPIVSEALNNFIVSNNGEEAAVADTVYNISHAARIVSAPRTWHQYLERDWKEVTPPPDILLPENAEERDNWRQWVGEGWDQGYKQADEIFQADLNRMTADFQGMVRYRILLAQNKISAPYATMEDRGVSGKETSTRIGNRDIKVTTEMRIGDRAIRITQPATLRADKEGDQWEAPMQVPQ